jgi:eukaryotic-like serine/threonine-protein kinase
VEALAAADSGKLSGARQLFADSIASARRHGFPENGANMAAMLALVEAEFRRQARVALDLGHGESEQGLAALALGRAGDSASAQRIAGSLGKKFPESTRTVAIRVPLIVAALRIREKEPNAPIHALEATAPYELDQDAHLIPIYLRGQAYLLARSGTEAAREFKKIIDHRDVDPESPLVALAHLGEARSSKLFSCRRCAAESALVRRIFHSLERR